MSRKHHRPWKKFFVLLLLISAFIIFMSYAWATNYQQILAFDLFALFQMPITSVGSFLYFVIAFLLLLLAMPVLVFVYGDLVLQIAYILFILITIGMDIVLASTGMSFFSSSDFKTTTITRTYHLDTHELDEDVRTPSDKAFTANFWMHLLLILLMVDFPFITLPVLLYLVWKGSPFSKKKGWTTLLLTIVSMGVLVGAGIGIQTIDFATMFPNTQEVTIATPLGTLTAHKNADRRGYTIVSYEGSDEEIAIPEIIYDLPVTSIGNNAFAYDYTIQEVVLPSTIVAIGNYAFRAATDLRVINFPEGLQSIGDWAFSNTKIAHIDLPSSLHTVGDFAFLECFWLQAPLIPLAVTTMGTQIFSYYHETFTIYCEIDVAPEGWDPHWDSISCTNGGLDCVKQHVVWNYTAE